MHRIKAGVLVMFVVVFVGVLAPTVEAKAAGMKLPSCDEARKHFDKGDLYKVLGVDPTANDKTIRKAFKKMSVQCHPDKDRGNEHAEDNFIAITGAYETLSNEEERRNYDMSRSQPGGGRDQQGSGQSQQQQGGWKPRKYEDVHVNDVFSKFFRQGGGGGGGGPQFFSYTSSSSSSSGGSAEDFDKTFESLFRNFRFERTQGPTSSSGDRRNGGTAHRSGAHGFASSGPASLGDIFGGLGSIFSDVNKGLGAFDSMGSFGGTGGSGGSGGARTARARARAGKTAASPKRTKPNSSKSKHGSATKTSKAKNGSSGDKSKAKARPSPPPPTKQRRDTRSQALKDKLRQQRGKQGTQGGCVYTLKDGEVCA